MAVELAALHCHSPSMFRLISQSLVAMQRLQTFARRESPVDRSDMNRLHLKSLGKHHGNCCRKSCKPFMVRIG